MASARIGDLQLEVETSLMVTIPIFPLSKYLLLPPQKTPFTARGLASGNPGAPLSRSGSWSEQAERDRNRLSQEVYELLGIGLPMKAKAWVEVQTNPHIHTLLRGDKVRNEHDEYKNPRTDQWSKARGRRK